MKKVIIPLNNERVEKEVRLARMTQRIVNPPSAPTLKNIYEAIIDLTQEVCELKNNNALK